MADGTPIEWTDMTWNPITGCSVVSPGCTNCYAMRLAGTRLKNLPSRIGLTRDTKAGPVWTGEIRFNDGWLTQPLQKRRPRMIFVCAHGDLFAEGVTDEMLDRIFAVMALASQHTFQVLTKRPERMRNYLTANWHVRVRRHVCKLVYDGPALRPSSDLNARLAEVQSSYGHRIPLPNVWLGVSAEDQRRADERVPILLDTPAAVRWVSAEPLLGPIDFDRWLVPWEQHGMVGTCVGNDAALNWIVAGGESGPGARPMHPEWVRSIRDQCAKDNVPFHFKQWGSWGRALPRPSGMPGRFAVATAEPFSSFWPAIVVPVDQYPRQITLFGGATVLENVGKKAAGRILDGITHDAYPQCDEVLF